MTPPLADLVAATGRALADPDRGRLVFRADGRATTGVASTVTVGRHTVTADEPPSLGGADAAPSPVHAALAALLSCQVVTYRVWAAKLGIALDEVHLAVEGDLDVRGFLGFDDAVRPGPGAIRVAVRLTGPEPAETYARLQAVVDEHCPVLDLFTRPTPVTTTLTTG